MKTVTWQVVTWYSLLIKPNPLLHTQWVCSITAVLLTHSPSTATTLPTDQWSCWCWWCWWSYRWRLWRSCILWYRIIENFGSFALGALAFQLSMCNVHDIDKDKAEDEGGEEGAVDGLSSWPWLGEKRQMSWNVKKKSKEYIPKKQFSCM